MLNLFDIFLLLSMALALFRLAKGPTAADRMVAVDLLGLFFGTLVAAQALRTGEESALDIVVVFSIVTYFGTVAVARHLQRPGSGPSNPNPPES